MGVLTGLPIAVAGELGGCIGIWKVLWLYVAEKVLAQKADSPESG